MEWGQSGNKNIVYTACFLEKGGCGCFVSLSVYQYNLFEGWVHSCHWLNLLNLNKSIRGHHLGRIDESTDGNAYKIVFTCTGPDKRSFWYPFFTPHCQAFTCEYDWPVWGTKLYISSSKGAHAPDKRCHTSDSSPYGRFLMFCRFWWCMMQYRPKRSTRS